MLKVSLLTLAAALAQLGERQTEDLKAPCSIHGGGTAFSLDDRLSAAFLKRMDNFIKRLLNLLSGS